MISDYWTKTCMLMMMAQRNTYSSFVTVKPNNIPRIIWLRKDWSCYQIHLEVFRFFRVSISKMYDT